MRSLRLCAAALPGVLAASVLVIVATPAHQASAAATPLGSFSCVGFNGLDNRRMLQADGERELVPVVMADGFKLPNQPVRKVGNGRGDITWSQPRLGISAETWLNSLEWLGALLSSERNFALPGSAWRDWTPTELSLHYARASAVTQDWLKDNAGWEKLDPRGPKHSRTSAAAHRLSFLLCLRAKIGAPAWLDTAITQHVDFLVGDPRLRDTQRYKFANWKPAADWPRWMGPNNLGLDQSVAVLGAACNLGRSDWATVALRRIDLNAKVTFDSQGANNEQAPGYAAYGYGQWQSTLERVKTCLPNKKIDLVDRLTRAVDFLTLAARPDGAIEAIGDTNPQPQTIPGTTAEFAATQGKKGPRPTLTSGIFNASNGGYAFGHSGWGSETRSFLQETYYSLRWGKGRLVHGHNDHMSLTYWARGHQVLADPGHVGYDDTPYRWWLRTPAAHSVLTASAPFDYAVPTALVSSSTSETGDSYVLSDVGAYAGVTRQRSVLVVDDATEPDVMIVLDKATSGTRHSYDQLWHLGPEWATAVQGTEVLATSGDTAVHVMGVPLAGAAAATPTVVKGLASGTSFQGWVSPALGQRVAAPTVSFPLSGTNVSALTVIVPTDVVSAVSATAVTEGSGLRITVTVGDRTVSAFAEATGVLHR